MKLSGKRAVFLLYACALLLPALSCSFTEWAGTAGETAEAETLARQIRAGGVTAETGADSGTKRQEAVEE